MVATQEIRTERIQISNGDLQIEAYLAKPAMDGVFPAIVVIQEVFGVNAHIRDITERLAQAGYVAIAPALYQRQSPGFEVGYTPDDLTLGRHYKDQTQADELLSDLSATLAHLKTRPDVKPEAIGCIGFCFGGHVAYLAATLSEIKATASFYGAKIPDWCPGGGPPTLTYTSDIQGVLYAFFGLDDPSIPPSHVDDIEAALQNHHIAHRIFRYEGAKHGFFCDRRDSYHPEAAADAWEKVQHLFSATLAS